MIGAHFGQDRPQAAHAGQLRAHRIVCIFDRAGEQKRQLAIIRPQALRLAQHGFTLVFGGHGLPQRAFRRVSRHHRRSAA